MSDQKVTVVGPTGSGKTTFFAALWFLLKNFRNQYIVAIDRTRLIDDREYLSGISKQWAQVKEIEHTRTGNWHPMELPLLHQETGKQLTLHIPDLAGESFENSLEQRTWTTAFKDNLEASHSILLFLGHKGYRAADFIDHKMLIALSEAEAIEPREWRPTVKIVPSDVYHTDMLQQVAFHDKDKVFRLSIILSAWDEIRNDLRKEICGLYLKPDQWLALKFPLLDQFLKSHPSHFEVKIFGVSAYGGDQNEEKARNSLSDMEPYERITVVHDGQASRDITLPISSFLLP